MKDDRQRTSVATPTNGTLWHGTVVLPGDPCQPCPDLLTETEAVRYLRIDQDKNPARTLKYYREKGALRATTVGRHLLYRRIELERFLERQTTGGAVRRA